MCEWREDLDFYTGEGEKPEGQLDWQDCLSCSLDPSFIFRSCLRRWRMEEGEVDPVGEADRVTQCITGETWY